jgi:hypothetical protein
MTLAVIFAALLAMVATPHRTCPPTPVKLLQDGRSTIQEESNIRNGAYNSVDVLVNAKGIVEAVTITRPSGFPLFDLRTVESAVNAKYQPRTINCKPVSGVYQFGLKLNIVRTY